MNTMTERSIAASLLRTVPTGQATDVGNPIPIEPVETDPSPTGVTSTPRLPEVIADAPADQGTDGPSTDQSQD